MNDRHTSAQTFEAECFCLGLQRAARVVARRYDQAFRPLGLTSHQFSLLAALLRDRPVPLTALAGTLGLDRTTLTRNLAPLEARRLVRTVADPHDKRIRGLALTKAGRAMVAEAIPLWRAAQADSVARSGADGWAIMRPLAKRLAD